MAKNTSKEIARRSKLSFAVIKRPRQAVIAIGLVGSIFAGWTLLAYSGADDTRTRKMRRGQMTIQSFNSNSPAKEYIYAGGRLIATEEPTGGGGCTPPSPPGAFTATALSTTSVDLNWSGSSGSVDHYKIERRNGSGSYSTIATPAAGTTHITDNNSIAADTAYLYRIHAYADQAEACVSTEAIDLATTTDFSVDPPATQGSAIRAVHLTRLRTAVIAVQATAGQSAFNWTDSSSPGVTQEPVAGGPIKKDQVQKLRNRLNDARSALGLAAQSFSNEPLTQGTRVFAVHISELRQGVQ